MWWSIKTHYLTLTILPIMKELACAFTVRAALIVVIEYVSIACMFNTRNKVFTKGNIFVKVAYATFTPANISSLFYTGFRLIWRRDAWRCQINVKTMLCMSTLELTTLKNIKSTLSITKFSMNNVKQRRNNVIIFNVEFYKAGNVKITFLMWPFVKIGI